jgi:hypothetical protein
MASLRLRFAFLFCTALGSLLAGCGDSRHGRNSISGTVKLKGALLDEGLIEFVPLEKLATNGGAEIKNGKYSIPAENGLAPGKYKVVITSWEGGQPTPVNTDEPPGPPGPGGASSAKFQAPKPRIPPEYNTASKQEVEVTESGPNVFDYDIP